MSLRSATQATDSTLKGWIAKIAATKALRQVNPVVRRRTRKSRMAVAAWRATFVKWCQPASIPKSWQSSMWESQVSGCQLPE